MAKKNKQNKTKKIGESKIQQKGIFIKNLLKSGFTPIQITKRWGFKKQMISYWKQKIIRKKEKKTKEKARGRRGNG